MEQSLTEKDRLILARPILAVRKDGSCARCDHEGGGVSYWRFITKANLVQPGHYEPDSWVVHVGDGKDIFRKEYPIEEETVPKDVRELFGR